MKIKKNFSLLIFLIVLVFLMTSLVHASDSDKLVLRFAHMNAPEHITHLSALEFARLVEEKTNGRVEIQVYPAGQLANLQESVEAVQQGTIALNANSMGAFAFFVDECGAFDTPYLFRDVDHVLKALDINSPIMKRLNKELIDKCGVRIISTQFAGTRHLTCDRAIYHPDDLKGIKIRSIPFKLYTAAVEGLGAIATPIDWSEVPTALATGIVQGQENPYVTIYAAKIYELQSHLMETGHIQQVGGYIMNEKIFQELDTDIQKAILEAAQEVGRRHTEYIIKEEESEKQKIMETGVIIITPENGLDIEAFRKRATDLVMERFGDTYKEFYEQIKMIE